MPRMCRNQALRYMVNMDWGIGRGLVPYRLRQFRIGIVSQSALRAVPRRCNVDRAQTREFP